MLAHLKAKRGLSLSIDNNEESNNSNIMNRSRSNSHPHQLGTSQEEGSSIPSNEEDDEQSATQMTCDVLCSLSSSWSSPPLATIQTSIKNQKVPDSPTHSIVCGSEKRRTSKSCPKQHQLPMFLSKTYHMIDRCEATIATWSDAGDNFVVKNVEKFASSVLPLYFKHSNFSSFARQLNFYGFRKLRTDPILTSDVDPRTACYVRFYHEKFQKDQPELLHQIKRATKSDQQSKDDVESLKGEVAKIKECMNNMSADFDRKLAEMSYEYNRRIATMSAEYDKLAALLEDTIADKNSNVVGIEVKAPSLAQQVALHNANGTGRKPVDPSASTTTSIPCTNATSCGTSFSNETTLRVPNLMDSLSQVAAMSLQNQLPSSIVHTPASSTPSIACGKRSAEDENSAAPSTTRPKTGENTCLATVS